MRSVVIWMAKAVSVAAAVVATSKAMDRLEGKILSSIEHRSEK